MQVSASSTTSQRDPSTERQTELDLQELGSTSRFTSVARLHSTNRHSTGEYSPPHSHTARYNDNKFTSSGAVTVGVCHFVGVWTPQKFILGVSDTTKKLKGEYQTY